MSEYREIYPQRIIDANDSSPGIEINQAGSGVGLLTNTLLRWDAGQVITAAQYEIGRDADGTNQLHFNVPTGASFEWSGNDVSRMTLTAAGLFTISNSTVVHVIGLHTFGGNILSTSSGDMDLQAAAQVNIAPAGGSHLILNPSGAGNVTVNNGRSIKSFGATPIGFQVTNAALTVGTLGSLVVPVKTTTGEATDAQVGNLDGSLHFNSFDNVIGVRDGVADNPATVAVAGYVIQSYVKETTGGLYHPNQIWQDAWDDKHEHRLVDETLCLVCGEDIKVDQTPIVFYPNVYLSGSPAHPERKKVHAIFGHQHLERDSYIKQLEVRIVNLEQKIKEKSLH